MSLCSNPGLQIAMLEWRSCEQITCGKLQRVAVSAICPPLHSTHGRKPTTITQLFNQIYIYMYKFQGCLISLFSSAQRKKKHTNKSSQKRTMEQQTPTPISFTSFQSLILFYFIYLLMMSWSICGRRCLRSFIFISVLVMSSLLCSKVTCVLKLLFALYFL